MIKNNATRDWIIVLLIWNVLLTWFVVAEHFKVESRITSLWSLVDFDHYLYHGIKVNSGDK